MSRRIVISIALLLIAATPLFAGLSSKYKEWPSSPQGLFMTKAERASWAAVKTDEEAEKFVQQFLSTRGGEFPAEVTKRAEMADKYLTIGKTPGSKTLRGKVIILLGPPAAMDVSDSSGGEGNRNAVGDTIPRSSGVSGASSNGGQGGMSVGDDLRSSVTNLGTMRVTRTYTFTFRNEIAKTLDRKEIIVYVTADANTGRDQWASRSDAGEIEKAFEAAAQASIVKPQQ